MQILKPLLKKYNGASLTIPNHILSHAKHILAAAMDRKWYAVMMINILAGTDLQR